MTVSNLGMFGVDSFTPIVVPGQSAILGVGRVRTVAVFGERGIEPALGMTLTISVDHRIADGAYAARFLAPVREFLESPQSLAWISSAP